MQRTRLISSVIAACLLLGFGTPARAVLIDPTLIVGDTYYLGHIVNGTPSSEAAEAVYINFLNDLASGAGATLGPNGNYFDRLNSTLGGPFPDTTAVGAVTDNGAVDFINTGSFLYSYVYAKYGGDAHVWFSGAGFSGKITVPGENPAGQGISHIALFSATPYSVPEPASLTLLGLGLLGVGFLARRRKTI